MTQVEAIRGRHTRLPLPKPPLVSADGDRCAGCRQMWPCDAIAALKLATDLAEAAKALQTLDDDGIWCFHCDELATVCTCSAGKLRAILATDDVRALLGGVK